MVKKIDELTAEDKHRYLDSVKYEIEKTGISWDFYEEKIIEDINNTFDDERFCKMNPKFAIDAAYARKHFNLNFHRISD